MLVHALLGYTRNMHAQLCLALLRRLCARIEYMRVCMSPIFINICQYLYLKVSDCVTHIWPIPMVCNNILRDIPERDLPRMYVHTHVCTYVLCENRSSIQSLVLMRLAIIQFSTHSIAVTCHVAYIVVCCR